MYKIIFESNTGFTEEYAKALSKEISVQAYTRKESKDTLSKSDKIIYMGWLLAGGIKGYEKFKKNHNVVAVCAVGAAPKTEKIIREISERHHIKNVPVFYLRGGIDKDKLKGINKFVINLMATVLSLLTKNKTQEQQGMADLLKNGGDRSDIKNLSPVIDWFKSETN